MFSGCLASFVVRGLVIWYCVGLVFSGCFGSLVFWCFRALGLDLVFTFLGWFVDIVVLLGVGVMPSVLWVL